MCSDESICFSYLEIYWVIETPFIESIWWIFRKSISVATMSRKYASEKSFLSALHMLRAVSFDLRCFASCKPLHLLFLSHVLSSVHISNLEKTIITSSLMASLLVLVELAFMIHESHCSEHSWSILEDFFHQLHLLFRWKAKIFPALCSMKACRIFLIQWLSDFASDFIDTSDDDRIVFRNYFRSAFSFCCENDCSTDSKAE